MILQGYWLYNSISGNLTCTSLKMKEQPVNSSRCQALHKLGHNALLKRFTCKIVKGHGIYRNVLPINNSQRGDLKWNQRQLIIAGN